MIEKRAFAVGLKLLRARVRHLGTEVNLEVLKKIYEELQSKISYYFKTEVKEILADSNGIKGVIVEGGAVFSCKRIFVAPGRDGSTWLK